MRAAVAIGVRDEEPMLVFAENKRQRIDERGGPVPRETIRPHVDRRQEVLLIARADRARRAIGRHHEIAVVELAHVLDFAPELDCHPERRAVFAQHAQQMDARHPVKRVVAAAARPHRDGRCASHRRPLARPKSRRRAAAPHRARTRARCRRTRRPSHTSRFRRRARRCESDASRRAASAGRRRTVPPGRLRRCRRSCGSPLRGFARERRRDPVAQFALQDLADRA